MIINNHQFNALYEWQPIWNLTIKISKIKISKAKISKYYYTIFDIAKYYWRLHWNSQIVCIELLKGAII